MSEQTRAQIGAFLRRKRESLAPEIAGLARTVRARTPGLRREDVAAMAGISTVWYSKIERGKADGISREVLLSLAHALQLEEAERQYLMALARLEDAPSQAPCKCVGRDTLRLLDLLNPLPALVINDYYDILAVNRAYEVMCGVDFNVLPEDERNYIRLILTNPTWQRFFQVEDEMALESRLAGMVGVLRNVSATRQNDATLKMRVDGFRALSAVFSRCWDRETVAKCQEMLFPFTHAVAGPMILRKQIWLNFNGETSGRLNVYHPVEEADFARLAAAIENNEGAKKPHGFSPRFL